MVWPLTAVLGAISRGQNTKKKMITQNSVPCDVWKSLEIHLGLWEIKRAGKIGPKRLRQFLD